MRAVLASLILLGCGIHAQLESCNDVGCPIDPFYRTSQCSLNDQIIEAMGVLNFTTSISPLPLQWTLGYIQPPLADKVEPDGRVFYLGQPAGTDIRQNTSIAACALFFNGVSPKLRFNNTSPRQNASAPKSGCDEALTSSCASDWLQQAQELVDKDNSRFLSCQTIADELEGSPPSSCKVGGKSWGKVTVRNMTRSAMPLMSDNQNCTMTEYADYSQTEIADINATKATSAGSFYDVTPVFTLLKSIRNDSSVVSEAHLSCLQPAIEIDTGGSSSAQAASLAVKLSSARFVAAVSVAVLFLTR